MNAWQKFTPPDRSLVGVKMRRSTHPTQLIGRAPRRTPRAGAAADKECNAPRHQFKPRGRLVLRSARLLLHRATTGDRVLGVPFRIDLEDVWRLLPGGEREHACIADLFRSPEGRRVVTDGEVANAAGRPTLRYGELGSGRRELKVLQDGYREQVDMFAKLDKRDRRELRLRLVRLLPDELAADVLSAYDEASGHARCRRLRSDSRSRSTPAPAPQRARRERRTRRPRAASPEEDPDGHRSRARREASSVATTGAMATDVPFAIAREALDSAEKQFLEGLGRLAVRLALQLEPLSPAQPNEEDAQE